MAVTTKARKGDLILVEEISTNHYTAAAHAEAKAAGKTLPETTTAFWFGLVGSATREGAVKTWRRIGFGDELVSSGRAEPIGYRRRWVMSDWQIDVAGALTAAKANHWPGHPGQPKAFTSFAEAREAVRPFLKVHVRDEAEAATR